MTTTTKTNVVGPIDSNTTTNHNPNDPLALLRWINLTAFIVNVAITYGVGVVGGFFGLQTNTVVSAKYPTLITPAGYAFAIWGIIFLLQGIWTIQQFIVCPLLLSSSSCCTKKSLPYLDQIVAVRMQYAMVVAAQVFWTLAFGNEWILASAGIMLVLLGDLAVIVFRQLPKTTRIMDQHSTMEEEEEPWYSFVLAKAPFHFHFGWILVASFVNVNVALSTLLPEGSKISANVLLYVGAIGSLVVLVSTTLYIIIHSGFYGVVPGIAVWGLVAVYFADQSMMVDIYSSRQLSLVRYGALASAILIAIVSFAQGVRKQWVVRTRWGQHDRQV